MNYVLQPDGTMRSSLVATYRTATQQFTPTATATVWPGGADGVPGDTVNTARLGIMLPVTGDWKLGRTLAGAAKLAIDAVNADPDILQAKTLEYAWADSGCASAKALAEYEAMKQDDGPFDAMIGPGCSRACEVTAHLTAGLNIPQISYSCTSAALSDETKFPTFVRTTSTYSSWSAALVGLMHYYEWFNLAIITTKAPLFQLAALELQAVVERASPRIDVGLMHQFDAFDVARPAATGFDGSAITALKRSKVRIVLVMWYGGDVASAGLAAQAQGTVAEGWAWIGLDTVQGSGVRRRRPCQRARGAQRLGVPAAARRGRPGLQGPRARRDRRPLRRDRAAAGRGRQRLCGQPVRRGGAVRAGGGTGWSARAGGSATVWRWWRR